jgi:hypothetical protein
VDRGAETFIFVGDVEESAALGAWEALTSLLRGESEGAAAGLAADGDGFGHGRILSAANP